MYLFDFTGERDGIRTHDLLIKSLMACCLWLLPALSAGYEPDRNQHVMVALAFWR
jgi:hypothetical protein